MKYYDGQGSEITMDEAQAEYLRRIADALEMILQSQHGSSEKCGESYREEQLEKELAKIKLELGLVQQANDQLRRMHDFDHKDLIEDGRKKAATIDSLDRKFKSLFEAAEQVVAHTNPLRNSITGEGLISHKVIPTTIISLLIATLQEVKPGND